MVVARGKKADALYMTTSSHDAIILVGVRADIELWRNMLGHMSEKRMKLLCSKVNC